ncbi:permease-like cell division protein FtsX [Histophilus somni]|uniref:permease-like cell division protein FtsX n=1 Tax=Histophilus somni TaxID=731 RepID=UPI000039716C|nr:permease-like cell division protein FtsX [Histophilus somni]ACA32117.1 putative protein insertion ABC transporter, inner membrane subunit FtsX [Histophilus somni 2336]QQF86302.1 cell division protein FtsX [Histophilus somni]QQJ89898.1 cell division protein FtsX [Histophilus somni]
MAYRPIYASWGVQVHYVLKAVLAGLIKKKYSTLMTILVIAVSLTIPTVSYLLWKNLYHATTKFSPKTEFTLFLHKNLSETDANIVVEKIRQQEGVESLNYISRKESLNEFRHFSGFSEGLDILDDNPLPAVVMIKLTQEYNENTKRHQLRENLFKIKGVDDIRLDNEWLEKLTALSWLIAHIAIFCAVLMVCSVFLVIGNSIRSDVYSSQANIEIMKLLGATDQFILRPYLYTGMIYAILGALFAGIFSAALIGYFTSAVKYVTDIFAVSFTLQGITIIELLFLFVCCTLMGYLSAWLSASRYMNLLHKNIR